MDCASNDLPIAISAKPAAPASANVAAPRCFAQSLKKKKSDRQSGERKRRPGENGKQPRLRLAEVVYAVDIGFERPRQPTRTPTRPQQWSQQGNRQRNSRRAQASTVRSRSREPSA